MTPVPTLPNLQRVIERQFLFFSDNKSNTDYDWLYLFYDIHQVMHEVQLLEWTSLILSQIYASLGFMSISRNEFVG